MIARFRRARPKRYAFTLPTALIVLLGVLGVVPASTAQIGPDTAARIDSVFAGVDRADGPGCAVGVTYDGERAYTEGYGLANLDYQRPVTPASVFDIASASKQFTAAAALLAAQQGLLSLDDPVQKWVPELPEYDSGPIALRHLIHHTSGLRDNYNLAYLAGWDNLDSYGTGDYLNLIYRQEGLNFTPGTDNGYSNTNYILLAQVVAAASDTSFRAYVDENIFDPLGMDDSHVHNDRNEVVRNRAVGYRQREEGVVMSHPWDYEIVGSGGVYSTVEDLARWTRNFDTEAVGGPGFTDQMTTRGRLANGNALGYAFGLRIGTYRGRQTVEHGGALEGFRSEYLRFPDDDRTVIVLCNHPADAGALARSVANLVLPGALAPQGRPASTAPPVDLAPRELRACTGLYHSAYDGYFRFFVDDGRLMGERSQAFTIPLRPTSPYRFTAPGPIDAFTFDDDGDGSSRVTVYRSTDTTSFQQIEPASYSDAEIAAFAGRYHSDELGVDYRVRVHDGTLQLAPRDRTPRPLSPGVVDEFQLRGGYVRFERSQDGTITGFVYNTRRVAGLHFDRRRYQTRNR